MLKKRSTDILTYCFAHSLNSKLRLYTPVEALEWEESFDRELAPAAEFIIDHVLNSSRQLRRHYLYSQIEPTELRFMYALLWPLLYWFKHRASLTKLGVAMATADAVFARVSSHLRKSPSKYLCGDSFTAADLTFASHAIGILFPRQDDHGNHIRLKLPPLKELQSDVREFVVRMRSSPAGKFALRMYDKERKHHYGIALPRVQSDVQRHAIIAYEMLKLNFLVMVLCCTLIAVVCTRPLAMMAIFVLLYALSGTGLIYALHGPTIRKLYRFVRPCR